MNASDEALIQDRIQQLRENTDFSATLFESLIGYAIIAADFDGNIIAYNEGARQIYGYAAQEIVGKENIENLFPRDFLDAGYFQQIVDVLLASGRFAYEGEKVRKNGERFPAQILFTLTKDKTGKVVGFVEIVQDLTAPKQAEKTARQLRATEAEFRSARAIQQKLFPRAAPDLPGFDIGGASYPAVATGGDLFDYMLLPDGSLDVVVGDVSGHGFGPALLMAEIRAYLRALALTCKDVGDILALANRAYFYDTDAERFATLILARLDPRTQSLIYVSAGHPAGYILSASGAVKKLPSTAIPLGVEAEGDYSASAPMQLQPGDLILLFSDGILEACSPEGELFGAARVLQSIRANQDKSAQDIVTALYDAARSFCRHHEQMDDITAVIIKVMARKQANPAIHRV